MKIKKTTALTQLALCSLVSIAAWSSASAATLTNHYTFDNNLNDSVGSLNGALGGAGNPYVAPGYVADAPVGAVGGTTSIDFSDDGTNISGFRLPLMPVSDAGSMSLWMSADQVQSGAYLFRFDELNMNLVQYDNVLQLTLNGGAINNIPFTVGDWSMVTMTWDLQAGDAEVYVNGVAAGSTTGIADPDAGQTVTGNNSHFGVNHETWGGVAQQFDGQFYDMQFYDGQLTAGEVTTLFNSPGATIPEPSAYALIGGVFALTGVMLRRRRA